MRGNSDVDRNLLQRFYINDTAKKTDGDMEQQAVETAEKSLKRGAKTRRTDKRRKR